MPPMHRQRIAAPAAAPTCRAPVHTAALALNAAALIALAALAAVCACACLRPLEAAAMAASVAHPARHAVEPSKDALALAELVRARWMGVDHGGNLWAWEALEGSVRFFSPTAERLGTVLVPLDTSAVDGDAQWGAAALAGEGSKLLWVRPGGAAGSGGEVKLPAVAGAVCWIDADTVAVSPQRAVHRVELWNLRERKLVKSFGEEREIALPTGATRVREVQLRYDPARRQLFTLETFSGDLEVFSLDGVLAWRARIENAYRKVEESSLADLDSRAKSRDMPLGRTVTDMWLAAAPDGSAWVSQRLDFVKQAAILIRATAAGTTVKEVAKLRCPSLDFTIWGRQLVFFRDIATPREVCNSVVPLP
jgi:hypothetical protein